MKKQINSIVVLRAAATMMVVMIHCLPNQNRGVMTDFSTAMVTFFHGILDVGVSVFIMITGALLIPRNEGYKKCLKRALRIAVVLFVFGTAMSLAEFIFTDGVSAAALIKSITAVISGKTWDVMWYLYMLIGIYLVMPIISGFAASCDQKTYRYILAVLFIFNGVISVINSQFGDIIAFYLPCGSMSMFYVLMGNYLYKYRPDINKILVAAGIIIPATAIFIISINGILLKSVAIWLECSSPIIAVMSVSTVLLFMNIEKENKFFSFIADNSFGIYVIHCFFIHIINKIFHIYPDMYPIYLSVPIIFIVVFGASLITAFVIRRIKTVRKFI